MLGIIIKSNEETQLKCPKCNNTVISSSGNLHRDTMSRCIDCSIPIFHPDHISKDMMISMIKGLQKDVESLQKDVDLLMFFLKGGKEPLDRSTTS